MFLQSVIEPMPHQLYLKQVFEKDKTMSQKEIIKIGPLFIDDVERPRNAFQMPMYYARDPNGVCTFDWCGIRYPIMYAFKSDVTIGAKNQRHICIKNKSQLLKLMSDVGSSNWVVVLSGGRKILMGEQQVKELSYDAHS